MIKLLLPLLVALASCQAPLRTAAAQQSTLRDASGRTIGTATTDSQGTVVFRDERGRTTGTATPSNGSDTILRDERGRTSGTLSPPPRSGR